MRTFLIISAVLAILIGLGAPARAAVSNAAVEVSLKKARAFLYANQKKGNWEEAPAGILNNDNAVTGGQWGGLSALCTYALLASGENPQDPKMAAAIDFLKKADLRGTYALGLRMQVWLLLPRSKDVTALARHDAEALLAMTQTRGMARGMHDYTALGHTYSHSRSQYAVLGLWAAEQMGLEVPTNYWDMAEAGWVNHQDRSGGWTYKSLGETEHDLTPGMTAAGVATLFITQDYLRTGRGIDCRGNIGNGSIEAGVAWLAQNFDKVASDTRYARDFPYISLYAVERVGVAGGLKYFGTNDWYDKGANWLLKGQKADGSFGGDGAGAVAGVSASLVDSSFSMLFLTRGRAPIAINKLDYTSDPKKPAAWNQRPRDVANAVKWMARQLEVDLNWQVVNLAVTPRELIDAPILYLAGSQPIVVTDAQAAKLKAYVEMGGMILGNADCQNAAFSTSFRKLGQKLFPYEFRELSTDHLIYHNLWPAAKWKIKPQIQGLSNGARELMLLVHGNDPAKFWQNRVVGGREESWQLAANIYRSTFEERASLGFKGDTHVVEKDPKIPAMRKASVARIEYAGNWDPEPGGWRRLAAIMNNLYGVNVEVQTVKPGAGKLAAHSIAHLTGTTRFSLDAAATEELRKFIAGGGTLVIDAAGGAAEFADAADVLVKALSPDAKPKVIEPEHPHYQLNGQPIAIAYRAFARKNLVGNTKAGRLMGVETGNRMGVIVSREDVSAALVGQNADGIIGYMPETATNLMASILLNAGVKGPPPRSPG